MTNQGKVLLTESLFLLSSYIAILPLVSPTFVFGHDVYTLDFEVLSDLAARNIFDLYRKASFYIIVSSVYFMDPPLVKQFEDTRYGYSQAYAWMKKIPGKEWEED